MDSNDVNALRRVMRLAIQHERDTGEFVKQLHEELPRLHRAIRLPREHADQALLDLVCNYIDCVPDCLQSVDQVAADAGIRDYTDTFINLARDYFLKPADSHQHLGELLGEAYLAHRLLEELNDRFMGHCGLPLAPVDMTMANLVVHELLGEEFANQLDLAVHYALELCIDKEAVFKTPHFRQYVTACKRAGRTSLLPRWPSLAEDKAINLEFSGLKDYFANLEDGNGSGALH